MKPRIHFSAVRNWMNDPNGLIYFNGKYHIFYQHFPYACYWSTMHWGHAISDDLIHFEHLPIALYPSKSYDRNGCFSGSAIEYNHQLYLYYTAIRYARENPEDIHRQFSDDDLISSQALVISKDGYTFDNLKDKHQVVDVIRDKSVGDVRHARDPKVWVGKNGHVYMIFGTKVESEKGYDGKVLFYESEDGLNFTYRNSFTDPSIGDMWECPDLFKLGEDDYLVFSPEHVLEAPKPTNNAMMMKVSFDEETCTLTRLGDPFFIDEGLDFYAPQTFLDKEGRRVMFGWMRMRVPAKDEDYVGLLTFPRVLEVKEDHLYFKPYPSVIDYFAQDVDTIDFNRPFYLEVDMNKDSELNLGGLKLSIREDCLYCDRQDVSIEEDQVCNINESAPLNGKYHLDIYYDHHIFEIYINDGIKVFSQLVYDLKDTVEFKNVDVRGMKRNSSES